MSELLSNALELGPLERGVIRSLEDARCAADDALREGLYGKYPAATVVLDMQVARLTAELNARAKQIGVACMKHDLIHALACGYCLREAERQRDELAEALRKLLSAPRHDPNKVYSQGQWTVIRIRSEELAQADIILARIDGERQP